MTHTSYEVSKKLKEFLGDSAPLPIAETYWRDSDPDFPVAIISGRNIYGRTGNDYGDIPAYQLHDLLSKPFTEAISKVLYPGEVMDKYDEMEFAHTFLNAYWDGGMFAVEKALLEMMEAK